MRADYADAGVRRAVYALLDTSFHRLSRRIALAETVGASWHRVSTAFVELVGDVAVAHAGVIEIPMVVAGQPRTVAGVHAVCTRPGHRGRGHAQAVVAEALEYVDDRFDLAILTTEIPGFYARFGFRVAEESIFEVAEPVALRRSRAARSLSERSRTDVELLHERLSARQPVSHAIASVDPGWLFLIDEVLHSWGFARLHHAPELDAILAFEVRERTLKLLDVVADEIPSLVEVLGCIPASYDRVSLHFTPDRVWDGEVVPIRTDPSDLLMVRGDFPLREPFVLPPLARC